MIVRGAPLIAHGRLRHGAAMAADPSDSGWRAPTPVLARGHAVNCAGARHCGLLARCPGNRRDAAYCGRRDLRRGCRDLPGIGEYVRADPRSSRAASLNTPRTAMPAGSHVDWAGAGPITAHDAGIAIHVGRETRRAKGPSLRLELPNTACRTRDRENAAAI